MGKPSVNEKSILDLKVLEITLLHINPYVRYIFYGISNPHNHSRWSYHNKCENVNRILFPHIKSINISFASLLKITLSNICLPSDFEWCWKEDAVWQLWHDQRPVWPAPRWRRWPSVRGIWELLQTGRLLFQLRGLQLWKCCWQTKDHDQVLFR